MSYLYIVENEEYMNQNNLSFRMFTDALKHQSENTPKSNIYVKKSKNSPKMVKVWDPNWEFISFYLNDPVLPVTKYTFAKKK